MWKKLLSNCLSKPPSFKDESGRSRKPRNSITFTMSTMPYNDEAIQCNFDDINFIRKAFYTVLYVFPNHSQSRLCEIIGRIIELVITVVMTYMIISDAYVLYIVIDRLPMGLTFSTFVTSICSFTVRLMLLYKKKSMLLSMIFIQKSYTSLWTNSLHSRRKKLSIAFFACFIIPTIETIYNCLTCYEESEDFTQGVFYGWRPDDYNAACIILLGVDTITTNQQYALPSFAIVLCCYVFGVFTRFMDKFSIKLKTHNDFRDIMFIYVKYSRVIYACNDKIGESFSAIVVFIYGYMICSIFNATTLLIRVDYQKTPITDLIPPFIVIITVLPAFFIISFRAASVNDAAERVKQTVHDIVARENNLDHKERNLLLAMSADFPARVVVTGWGLFTLKRSFIQGTAGVMITYSILLSQLGK